MWAVSAEKSAGEQFVGVSGKVAGVNAAVISAVKSRDLRAQHGGGNHAVQSAVGIGGVIVVVAIDTGLVFVTTAAELRVGAGRDRMRHLKIATMYIGQGVGEFPLLVGKPGLMAFHAEILLMTGRAIGHVGFGRRTMAHPPEWAMAFERREFDRVGKCLVVAFETDIQRRNDALRAVAMTG